MTADNIQTTLNKSLTLMQAIVLVGGVVIGAAGTWFNLNLRVSAIEWKVQEIAPSAKDYQAIKDDVTSLKFFAQESIKDRGNLHAEFDKMQTTVQQNRDEIAEIKLRSRAQ